MITQIELDGFKTFKDFKVELAPFQVIVGPNGVGKSNLFDALRLLSRLANMDVLSAFQGSRGEDDELFTILPDGKTVDRMRLAVEMLVDRKVQDDLGGKGELNNTRLRYELEVVLHTDQYGLERPYIIHESLKAIPREEDYWCKKYHLSSQNGWLPAATGNEATFIDTDPHGRLLDGVMAVNPAASIITLYRDDQKQGNPTQYRAMDLQRTLLSTAIGVEYQHVLAARKEFLSFTFLHLSPAVLRKSGLVRGPRFLSEDGSNLPTTLARIQAEDEFALTDISHDIANLVPGILKIRLEKNAATNEYDIWVTTADQRSLPAQVLSDGTLRLLAIATLRNDPQFHGVLCLEELENGVDPLHLKDMVYLLREMVTDFDDFQQVEEPLRQVLVTTHSPTFVSIPEILDALMLAIKVTRVEPHQSTLEITRMVPVPTPNTPSNLEQHKDKDMAIEIYAIDQIKKYLNRDDVDEALELLQQARATLLEG
ncbi:MAG TPA: AAA family ATPase [Ktedonobacteraceae bacterium]|nr:AAA family ATPase [Ktedonobacteraceae bacterium]